MLKKFCSLFLAVPAACIFMNTAFASADFSNLVVFHTNDTHGFDEYNEKDGNMGMAVIAQIRKDYIADGYDVLLADVGDFSQDNMLVNFSEGHAAIEFMKNTGYDIAAVGNHDFYYGQENLLKYAEEALKIETGKSSFPIISCNVLNEGKNVLTPNAIITKGDLKIGLVGITTPETKTATTPSAVAGLDFVSNDALYVLVQEQVDVLRGSGCDLVIALGHLGNQEILAGSRSKDVIANVSGIDFFIDGHDHAIVNGEYVSDKNGNEILLAEAGDHTEYLGMITYKDGKWVENLIPFEIGMAQDPTVAAIVAAESAKIEATMGQVFAKSDFLLMGSNKICRSKETNLSDLFTDAILWRAKRDITDPNFSRNMLVIQNSGGIRASFGAGGITAKDVETTFPYKNNLFCVQVKGSAILEMLEAACQAENDGAFPCVANARFSLNTKVPYVKGEQYPNSVFFAPANPGARVTIYEIDGQPFDSEKVYNLVCNDFMLEGGDTYGILPKEGTILSPVVPINGIASEVVTDYITEELGGVIPVKYNAAQGRLVIVGVYDVDSPSVKSLTETRAAGMAVLNTAADLATGKGFASAQAAAETNNGFVPYVAASGSDMRYNTGSHINTEGWGINVGFARTVKAQSSKLTLAPFVEYGKVNYDSYLDNGVHGCGDSSFGGIGFMAKKEENSGLHYEASVRLGRVKGDFMGEWHLGRYDTTSNYLALHAGIGRVQKVNVQNSIDYYGKLFYTHQYGDEATVSRPEIGDSFTYNFDAISSCRLRLGTRVSQKFNETDSFFVGLAYDHEFDSEARAQCNGVATPSPSMKGSSGMLEIGWKKEATKRQPFGAEVGLTGWTGKQKGVYFNAGFNLAF